MNSITFIYIYILHFIVFLPISVLSEADNEFILV